MDKKVLLGELKIKAVRSSGAGGQHVNKVSTKIELLFDLASSEALTPNEKELILMKLGHRLTKSQQLILQVDESRSQHRNKALAILRFIELLETALKRPKKRKRTKPSRAAIEKRLASKKRASLKKKNRKRPPMD